MRYMSGLFNDWQAKGITSVLHEKRGGYANNVASMSGLVGKAQVPACASSKAFASPASSSAITVSLVCRGAHRPGTDRVRLCRRRRRSVGPRLLEHARPPENRLHQRSRRQDASRHPDVALLAARRRRARGRSRFPEDQRRPHAARHSCRHRCSRSIRIATGKLITEELWGLYYKPDFHFNGVQGGAMPYKVDKPVDEVAIDPYGPDSPEFVASTNFADMWTSALAFCHKRFEGKSSALSRRAIRRHRLLHAGLVPGLRRVPRQLLRHRGFQPRLQDDRRRRAGCAGDARAGQRPARAVPPQPLCRRQAASGVDEPVSVELTRRPPASRDLL